MFWNIYCFWLLILSSIKAIFPFQLINCMHSWRKILGQRFWYAVFFKYFVICWCFCSLPSIAFIPKPKPNLWKRCFAWCGATIEKHQKLGNTKASQREHQTNNLLRDTNISFSSLLLMSSIRTEIGTKFLMNWLIKYLRQRNLFCLVNSSYNIQN